MPQNQTGHNTGPYSRLSQNVREDAAQRLANAKGPMPIRDLIAEVSAEHGRNPARGAVALMLDGGEARMLHPDRITSTNQPLEDRNE